VLAVALSLAASCSWGVADFAGGLFSRRWHAVAVLLVVETAGLLTAGIIVVAAAEPFPDARSALLALVAGTAGIAGLGLFFSALSVGSMSIVAPLAATGAVVPVAVGVATGDRITVVIGIGLAVALAGIALAAQEGGEESGAVAGHHGRSVALAFAAALAFGTFFVAYDGAADGSVSWAILLARVPAIPLAGGLMAVRRIPPVRGPDLLKVGVAGQLDCVATALYAAAVTRGELSVVAVVGSLYPVATVLLARAVLGERLRKAQAIGVLAALAGVALVSAGSA
jgi:drug/metabolite transporter (DMT)-like permease